jgi:arylsulfatase A-like enzyme
MGAYGNDQIETPALDRLAATGTVFENAYCTQPVCTPSRSSVMTGRYPHSTGCLDNGFTLPRSEQCLPEFPAFDEYATGYIGKWDLGDEVFSQHGFEEWTAIEDMYRALYAKHRYWGARSAYSEFLSDRGFRPDADSGFGEHPNDSPIFSRRFSIDLPEEYSKPSFMSKEASAFIRRHSDEPFLLSVSFLEPHPPFDSPRTDQYDPEDVPLPPNFKHNGFDDQCTYIQTRREAINDGKGDSLDGVHTGLGENPTESDWRDLISRYWGLVSLVDTHVGRILRTLSACGLNDRTIIIFTSDHGEHMGSHGVGGKRTMFEESAGVPLLMRVPGTDTGGKRVTQPVSQIDLVPTLIEAVGGTLPSRIDGESWMPWFRDGGEFPPRDVFIESNFATVPDSIDPRVGRAEQHYGDEFAQTVVGMSKRAIVTPDRMKYVHRPEDQDSLYNLKTDPQEINNLAVDSEYEETLAEFRERLADVRRELADPLV